VGAGTALVVLLAAGGAGRVVSARADDKPKPDKEALFEEAGACARCHTQPLAQDFDQGSLNFVLLTEYSAWKTQDKHAQAFAVLGGSRARQMAVALGLKVTDEAAGCLGCHAMNNLPKHKGQSFDARDGVSCGGCHGPSEKWLGEHSNPPWRERPPEEKVKSGMWEVRSPRARAELCASCHVGNAAQGKVLTHAMYAAGHPPLPPFEVASFSRNMPQHWRDMRDVPYLRYPPADKKDRVAKNYPVQGMQYQQTWLGLVGGVVVLRESMRLIAERAGGAPPGAAPEKVWPELLPAAEKVSAAEALRRWPELALSHSDCGACHHDLKVPAWRQERGYGYRLPDGQLVKGVPGRPQVRLWPMALLEVAVRYRATRERAPEAALEASLKELREKFGQLAAACNATPLGDPKRVGKAAEGLANYCDQLIAALEAAPPDRDGALEVLRSLCTLKTAPFADAESARQVAAFLKVVYGEVAPDHDKKDETATVIRELDDALNVTPYARRSERQKLMNKVLGDLAGVGNLKGMDEFYMALNSLGDLELQKKQRDNPFLDTVLRRGGNKRLTDEFQKRETVEKLQELGDEELRRALDKMSAYDPTQFQARLAKLAKLLPARQSSK
jgi:hypothetical protein